MPTTYSEADADVFDFVTDVYEAKFPQIYEIGVTITVLMATNEDGAALKHGGYPAAAMIRVTSTKDRVAGLNDVVLYIDAGQWKDLSDIQREALVFHELYHLEPKYDKDGVLKRDDNGRPKIGLRKHDFQIGGFHAVVEQYKTDALEAQLIIGVEKHWKQGNFFDDKAWG